MSHGKSGPARGAPRRQWLVRAGALALPGLLPPLAAPAQTVAPGGTKASASSNGSADISSQEAKAPALPALGSRLTLPALELLDGQRLEPSASAGRVLLLYWWASWCPFCALVSPEIDKLWRAERAKGLQGAQGLMLLTLSVDRRPEDARAYLQRRQYAWPTAWVNPALQAQLPKPRGLPATLVRGRDGRVLQAEAGQLFPEDVQALARHL